MSNTAFSQISTRLNRPQIVIELAAITLIALLFFASALSFRLPGEPRDLNLHGLNPTNRFGGIEYERLAGVLLPIEIGLKRYDHIPTWNPYLNTGTPLLNNAFNYLFNPFASLPVLLMGGVQGTKVAIFISLLLSGWNMWALMRAIGVGAVARVAAGAFYLASGGIAAKYYTGHFQLGLSLAWPPLVFAGLWWTLHTTDRRAPLLMAVAFALLFFSGNIYYSLHVILCCGVILTLHLFDRDEATARWRIRWDRVRRVAIGGLFALGLSAIQFIPIWETRGFVIHESIDLDGIGQIAGRYDMSQALVNYVYPWERWYIFEIDAFGMFVVVDYAYIGPGVFLFVLALIFGLRSAYRKAVIAGLVLAGVMMVWGAGQTPILHFLYTRIELLSEFRYLGRAHSIGALWIIVLAAIGIDNVWRFSARLAANTFKVARTRLVGLLLIVTLGWLWFYVFSLLDHSTRLQLALNIVPLFTFLEARALTNYQHAAEVLWVLVALALALDSLLTLSQQLIRERRGWLRLALAHSLRVCLVVLVFTTLGDLVNANSSLIRYGPPINNFDLFYQDVRAGETHGPFAAITEPFSPSAFDAYYNEIRNWFLNEGWLPRTLPNIIPPDAPELLDIPGWTITSNEYSGAAYELALDFLNAVEHERIRCIPQVPSFEIDDPCNFDARTGAALYYLPESLPYAFIAPQETVRTAADTITAESANRPDILLHQQDTLHILAQAPADAPHYLIVQETNFPGWQAFVDDVPVAPVTIKRFVGIPMQPGPHTYTLRFEPPGMAAGLLTSLASLLLAFFYLRGNQTEAA